MTGVSSLRLLRALREQSRSAPRSPPAARNADLALTVVRSYGIAETNEMYAVRLMSSLTHGCITLELAGTFAHRAPSSETTWLEALDDLDRSLASLRGLPRPWWSDSFAYAKLSVMDLLGVSEAAERLGVSTRQVQHLVANGDLCQVARGVVDETSVERLIAVRGGSHRRAWSEATAWGAVAILSGADAEWMGERQRSRVRARLRELSAVELVERARERAVVTRYRAHSSAGKYLLTELVHSVGAAGRLGLADTNNIDGYVAADDVAGVVSRHGLTRDEEGRVSLRATTMDLDRVRDLSERGVVLAAMDLAESLDVRERRAGLDAIESALEDFRG